MIAYQSVKSVHAVRPAGVEEGEAGRSGQRESIAVGNNIGHVVGDQSVGPRQHLLFAAGIVEANQTVGGGDIDRAGLRVRKNTIHAEDMIVFYMPDAAVVRCQQIEAAVEV